MIYLLDGTETYKLAQQKNKLLHAKDMLEENIISIDASNASAFNLSNALLHCNTVSLFSEHRAVVLEDPYFLNPKGTRSDGTEKKTSRSKKDRGSMEDMLKEYCENPTEDTDLIFYCFGFDADKRTREFKLLESYNGHTVTHMHYGNLSPWELEKLIDHTLQTNHYHLTRDARAELLLRIAGQTTEFYKALDKLDLYGVKDLTLEDIEHLVPVSHAVNIWKFADNFIAHDATGCYRSLKEITEIEGLPYQNVMLLLAGRLRTLYNVLCLQECGVRLEEIKKRTQRNYPDKDIKSAHGLSSMVFLGWLSQLADLDQSIKAGRVTDREGLELFLLRNL